MTGTTEAYSRVKIDSLLGDAGWDLTDATSVHSVRAGRPFTRIAMASIPPSPPPPTKTLSTKSLTSH